MTGQGFNELPGLDHRTGREPSIDAIGFMRRWSKRVVSLAIAIFDWQWERRQRAYERRLVAGMDARDRKDAGMASLGAVDESLKRLWEAD